MYILNYGTDSTYVLCVSVSRVVNCHGPRLHPFTSPVKRDTGGSTQRGNKASDVQERLNNLETHLKITPDTSGAISSGDGGYSTYLSADLPSLPMRIFRF